MTAFQDRIRAALAQVDPSRMSDGPLTPFDRVLQDFIKTLEGDQPFLGASIERGDHPQMRSLVTWPRYRRDERAVMLTFWWDGTTMRVVNEKDRPPFRSPEELGDYLVEFLTNSAFPATLAEYVERCNEDLDGFMRTNSLINASPTDVMVVVSAADQKAIATTQPGSMLNVQVEPQRVPGTEDYAASRRYAYLLSGGYGLRILTHRLADGRIHLEGEVMPSGAQ